MIYPYRCSGCGYTADVTQRVADYVAKPRIPVHCGKTMLRTYTVPMLAPDYQPFVSQVDGSVINSRSAAKEHMARHGVVLYDDIASEFPAARKAMEEAHPKEIRRSMHDAITQVEQGYKPRIESVDDVVKIEV